jgi:hypothetical protein
MALLNTSEVRTAAVQWESGMTSALHQLYTDKYMSSKDKIWDWETTAVAIFAMGGGWVPKGNFDAEFLKLCSLSELIKHVKEVSIASQAMLALILKWGPGTTTEKDKKQLWNTLGGAWYSRLRVQGRTAYVADADDNGSPQSLGLATNALVLRAFSCSELGYQQDPLVSKLASYVAGEDRSDPYAFGSSGLASIYASLALTAYDRAHNSTRPKLSVSARTTPGNVEVLSGNFTNASQHPVSNTVAYSQETGPKSLSFEAQGTGEASFVLGIDFVPLETFREPVFYGLFVEKRYRTVLSNGSLAPIYNVSEPLVPGSVLQIDIQVTLEDDQPGGVILEDLLPAPFQALDPNLSKSAAGAVKLGVADGFAHATASHSSPAVAASVRSTVRFQPPPPPLPPSPSPTSVWQPPPPPSPSPTPGPGGFNPYSWFPDDPYLWGFQRIEVYKDRVQCFTPYAAAGSIICSYQVEVVTSGTKFILPPSHAYVVTDPGTMGLSAAANISVRERVN